MSRKTRQPVKSVESLSTELSEYYVIVERGTRGVEHNPEDHGIECREFTHAKVDTTNGTIHSIVWEAAQNEGIVDAIGKAKTSDTGTVTRVYVVHYWLNDIPVMVQASMGARPGKVSTTPDHKTLVKGDEELDDGVVLVLTKDEFDRYCTVRGLNPKLGIAQTTILDHGMASRGVVVVGEDNLVEAYDGEGKGVVAHGDLAHIEDRSTWAFQSNFRQRLSIGSSSLLMAHLSARLYGESHQAIFDHLVKSATEWYSSLGTPSNMHFYSERKVAGMLAKLELPALPESLLSRVANQAAQRAYERRLGAYLPCISRYARNGHGLPRGVSVASGMRGWFTGFMTGFPHIHPSTAYMLGVCIGQCSRDEVSQALRKVGVTPTKHLVNRVLNLAHLEDHQGVIWVNDAQWALMNRDYDGDGCFFAPMEHSFDVTTPLPGEDYMERIRGMKGPRKTFDSAKGQLTSILADLSNGIGLAAYMAIQWPVVTMHCLMRDRIHLSDPKKFMSELIEASTEYAMAYQAPISLKKFKVLGDIPKPEKLQKAAGDKGLSVHPDTVINGIMRGRYAAVSPAAIMARLRSERELCPLPTPIVDSVLSFWESLLASEVTVMPTKMFNTMLSIRASGIDPERRQLMVELKSDLSDLIAYNFPKVEVGGKKVSTWELLIIKAADMLGKLTQAEFAWLAIGDSSMETSVNLAGNASLPFAFSVAVESNTDMHWLREEMNDLKDHFITTPLFPSGVFPRVSQVEDEYVVDDDYGDVVYDEIDMVVYDMAAADREGGVE